jgi:hypothetical protein
VLLLPWHVDSVDATKRHAVCGLAWALSSLANSLPALHSVYLVGRDRISAQRCLSAGFVVGYRSISISFVSFSPGTVQLPYTATLMLASYCRRASRFHTGYNSTRCPNPHTKDIHRPPRTDRIPTWPLVHHTSTNNRPWRVRTSPTRPKTLHHISSRTAATMTRRRRPRCPATALPCTGDPGHRVAMQAKA